VIGKDVRACPATMDNLKPPLLRLETLDDRDLIRAFSPLQ
jgi:hypothetical protein